jgi:protein transport protein SEC24
MLPNRPNPFPMENDNSQYNYSKDYSSSFENNNNKELDSKYKNLNCSKEYLRSTINIFPKYESQLNQLKIPIGVIISPSSIYTKKGEFPLISYGEDNEVPRCKNENCKAFVNPFIKIIDNDKWQCNICKAVNKMEDYFYKNEEEKETKIELNNGSYEFLLNKSYWKNNRPPNKLNYYFVIDISHKSIESGFAQCSLEIIKDCVINNYFYNYDSFPIKICLITYDTSVHFYSINEKSNQFTMYFTNESNEKDLFVPTFKDNLLVSLKENKNKLVQIIESIQNNIYNQSTQKEKKEKNATKIYEAIKCVNLLGNTLGGKILVFSGSDLKNLEIMNDKKDENDNEYEKEKGYDKNLERGGKKLGQLGIDVTYNSFSINVFQASDEFCKILTINQMCDNSNGNLYFYKNFNSELHYKNLYNQIKRILTNETQLEGTLKLRISNGYYINEYITSVLLYNRRLFVFPTHDSDEKYIVQLSMLTQEELAERKIINDIDDYIYMQSCLLYSHGDGTRRMRVHNLCLPISTNNKDIFYSIDPEFLACFLAQKSSHLIFKYKNIEKSMNKIENQFVNMMKEYFNAQEYNNKNLNEDMCKLILLFLGVMKLCIFNPKKISGILNDIDLCNFFRLKIVRMTVEEILCFIYPRIYLLDNILNLEQEDLPDTVNDSFEGINQGNLFLVDNGFYLTLYCKKNLDKNICKNLFGEDDYNNINFLEINENNVLEGENKENGIGIKIKNLVEYIREGKSLYQNLIFVFEGINDENFLKEILVEDNFNKAYPYDYNKFYEKIKSKSYI